MTELPTGPALDAERAARPAPVTPEQIREAASILRVVYLPVMTGAVGEGWRARPDVAESLASLLDALATQMEDRAARGSLAYHAQLTRVVAKILESHR